MIDPTSGQWDFDLLKQTFSQEDADLIAMIPLREGMEDFPAWHFDTKGVFSVKSAYRLCVQQIEQTEARNAQSNNQPQGDTFWHQIWSMPCPNKIKMFVWRLAHNSLAFNMNLRRRIKIHDTRCFMCKRLDEDGAHLFIKCKKVKECWRLLGLENLRCLMVDCTSAMEVIRMIVRLPVE